MLHRLILALQNVFFGHFYSDQILVAFATKQSTACMQNYMVKFLIDRWPLRSCDIIYANFWSFLGKKNYFALRYLRFFYVGAILVLAKVINSILRLGWRNLRRYWSN